MAQADCSGMQKGPHMSEHQRTALIALYAALAAVTAFPLSETTRRALRGALAALGRDLKIDSDSTLAPASK